MKKSNRSAWYGSTSRAAVIVGLGLALGLLPKAVHAVGCVGDCNVNGTVAPDELLDMVDVALGEADVTECNDGFASTDGKITVDEILKALNTASTNSGACGAPSAICGDGVKNGTEECDNGGSCLGGMDAGKHCAGESDCRGDGVCLAGTKVSTPCSSNSDCPGSICQKCIPQGGDGCAENCTNETDIAFTLKPGEVDDVTQNIKPGGSGAVVHGNLQIPLPLTGSQTFTVGKQGADGLIPVVVKASSVQFPKIDVMGLACACVRGVAAKTCGGTAFAKAGGAATDCTPGFATDTHTDGPCPADLPCAFVHGDGISASGELACGATATLNGVNISVTQDDANAGANGGSCTTDAQCTGLPGNSTCVADPDVPGHKFCSAGPSTLTLSGTGGTGAGILINSTAIGQTIGACGASPTFCSSLDPFSDPKAIRGSVATIPILTGTASGQFTTANGIPDNTVCQCSSADFLSCCPSTGAMTPDCMAGDAIKCTSPFEVSGALVNCPALVAGNVSGASLATSFTSAHIPIVGDSVVTTVFFAQ